MHFEVYESLDAATARASKLRTSQLAIPEETCAAVYATAGYERSVANLSGSRSTATWSSATATRASSPRPGGVEDGITLSLNVGVRVSSLAGRPSSPTGDSAVQVELRQMRYFVAVAEELISPARPSACTWRSSR